MEMQRMQAIEKSLFSTPSYAALAIAVPADLPALTLMRQVSNGDAF